MLKQYSDRVVVGCMPVCESERKKMCMIFFE